MAIDRKKFNLVMFILTTRTRKRARARKSKRDFCKSKRLE
jgi:hypothetical protein